LRVNSQDACAEERRETNGRLGKERYVERIFNRSIMLLGEDAVRDARRWQNGQIKYTVSNTFK